MDNETPENVRPWQGMREKNGSWDDLVRTSTPTKISVKGEGWEFFSPPVIKNQIVDVVPV